MSMFQQGLSLKALLENPDLINPPSFHDERNKEKKNKDPDAPESVFNAQSAFLGPQLWERTLPYDGTDFKLEYMDLDEFLEENGIPLADDPSGIHPSPTPKNVSLPPQPAPAQVTTPPVSQPMGSLLEKALNSHTHSPQPVSPPESVISRAETPVSPLDSAQPSPSTSGPGTPHDPNGPFSKMDLALATIPGQDDFDPRKRAFSEEELRPQPMIKKSRKIFVPEESKDDKYWARRKKNNIAAKRSRDARRIKENQIAMRAAFLEKQNDQLRANLANVKSENAELKKRLEKYEG